LEQKILCLINNFEFERSEYFSAGKYFSISNPQHLSLPPRHILSFQPLTAHNPKGCRPSLGLPDIAVERIGAAGTKVQASQVPQNYSNSWKTKIKLN